MKSPLDSLSPEITALEQKIAQYKQFQWLALMPAWLPGILGAMRSSPTVPGREGYVLAFRVAMFVFGVVCFAFVLLKIKKMKAQLERLKLPNASSTKPLPPIASP